MGARGGPAGSLYVAVHVSPHASLKRDGTELYVLGNPIQLEQVFINLLTNAIRYSPEGTAVRVSARELPDDGMIEVSVVDEGIGIAPEVLPRIFAAFDQGDTGTTRPSSLRRCAGVDRHQRYSPVAASMRSAATAWMSRSRRMM